MKKVECVGKNDYEHVENCDIDGIAAFIEPTIAFHCLWAININKSNM